MTEDYQEWFTMVYTETLADVRRCAFAFIKPYPDLRIEVEDILQETYIRMFKNRELLYGQDDVVKWLVVTLRYLVSNRLRVRKTHRKYKLWDAEGEDFMEETLASPYGVVDQAFASDDQEKLNRIAETIGNDKLELLYEYYLDKVPLDKLAEKENITPDAMKMRISRLRKRCTTIFIIIFFFGALLLRGFVHIGGEGHGNQRTTKVYFGARGIQDSTGRDEQDYQSDGYDVGA